MKATLVKRTFFFMLAMAILLSMVGCGIVGQPTKPTGGLLQFPTTDATGGTEATDATGATVIPTTPAITEPTDGTLPGDATNPTVTDPTEDTPVIGTTPTAPTTPATPKPTTPKPTEPKPTTPKPTEPKPTEPKPTEPKPTEPAPTEPVPTEPVPTEPAPTEAPTEPPTEPHEYIDIEALIEYGHQYGKKQWGFEIDREMGLHGDPVGYFPPNYRKITTMEEGKKWVAESIDSLAELWIANGHPIWKEMEDGTIGRARLRIGIEPDGDDYYWIYAYYG